MNPAKKNVKTNVDDKLEETESDYLMKNFGLTSKDLDEIADAEYDAKDSYEDLQFEGCEECRL